MNKQPNRKTHLTPAKYNIPLKTFCKKYNREEKVVMRRLNTKKWMDYDAIVVPTELGDTTPNIIAEAMKKINNPNVNLSNASIAKSLGIPEEHVEFIRNMSEYEHEIYSHPEKYFMSYFYLKPSAIDVSRIFEPLAVKDENTPQLTPP